MKKQKKNNISQKELKNAIKGGKWLLKYLKRNIKDKSNYCC